VKTRPIVLRFASDLDASKLAEESPRASTVTSESPMTARIDR
jgi:hypothetical protein